MRLCSTKRRLQQTLLLLPLAWGCDVVSSPAGDHAAAPPVPKERLASATARERGRALYLDNCVLCHGENADGRGVRSFGLSPKPRDYGNPAWRSKATPSSVYVVIRDGVANTAMPSWNSFTEDQIWDLVAYVMSVAEQGP